MVSMVCGAPLCDDCEHEVAEDGTNGGQMKHCKITDQKHEAWYNKPPFAQPIPPGMLVTPQYKRAWNFTAAVFDKDTSNSATGLPASYDLD